MSLVKFYHAIAPIAIPCPAGRNLERIGWLGAGGENKTAKHSDDVGFHNGI
jgi:hypothetical protein